jgi:hypothetical protein
VKRQARICAECCLLNTVQIDSASKRKDGSFLWACCFSRRVSDEAIVGPQPIDVKDFRSDRLIMPPVKARNRVTCSVMLRQIKARHGHEAVCEVACDMLITAAAILRQESGITHARRVLEFAGEALAVDAH